MKILQKLLVKHESSSKQQLKYYTNILGCKI